MEQQKIDFWLVKVRAGVSVSTIAGISFYVHLLNNFASCFVCVAWSGNIEFANKPYRLFLSSSPYTHTHTPSYQLSQLRSCCFPNHFIFPTFLFRQIWFSTVFTMHQTSLVAFSWFCVVSNLCASSRCSILLLFLPHNRRHHNLGLFIFHAPSQCSPLFVQILFLRIFVVFVVIVDVVAVSVFRVLHQTIGDLLTLIGIVHERLRFIYERRANYSSSHLNTEHT